MTGAQVSMAGYVLSLKVSSPQSIITPLSHCPRLQHGCGVIRERLGKSPPISAVSYDVDIAWPDGHGPKRSSVTRASLNRLKVNDLRSELARRGQTLEGKKEDLVTRLWELLKGPSTDAASSTLIGEVPTDTLLECQALSQTASGTPPQGPRGARGSTRKKKSAPPALSPGRVANIGREIGDLSAALDTGVHSEQQQGSPALAPQMLRPAESVQAQAGALASSLYEELTKRSSRRIACYDISKRCHSPQEMESCLSSNATELMLTFLGTAPQMNSPRSNVPSIAVLRPKDAWIFDAGEDTQRQLLAMFHVRPAKVFRIFLTSMSADRVLGLPGLLCSLAASRVRGAEKTDIPIHVYGPPGVADYLATMFQVSYTYLEASVIIHELVSDALQDDEQEPQLVNQRARLWRRQVPPDQLNPMGYLDGDLTRFMPTQGRGRTKQGRTASGGVLGLDRRACYLPLDLPPPGQPDRQDLGPDEFTWTIHIDQGAIVSASRVSADWPSWAYLIKEADRSGSLDPEKCEALGVKKGRDYSRLKMGETVVSVSGQEVHPEMCVNPPKQGRKVAIVPACSALPRGAFEMLKGVDLLVCESRLTVERDVPPGEGPEASDVPPGDMQHRLRELSSREASSSLLSPQALAHAMEAQHVVATGALKEDLQAVEGIHLDEEVPLTTAYDFLTLVLDKP